MNTCTQPATPGPCSPPDSSGPSSPLGLWPAGSGLRLPPGRRPTLAAAGCASPATQRQVAAATRVAVARYALERDGLAVHVALGQIAGDRVLTDALAAGKLVAARSEAVRQVVHGHHHVTAIRVRRGSRVLVETDAYPFDVAGAQAPLRDRRGAVVGTLDVTIQDVIGFIRLVHEYRATQVVVRGAHGEAKSSIAAALAVHLPAAGCAAVGRPHLCGALVRRGRLHRRAPDDLDPHHGVGRTTQPSHSRRLPAAQPPLLPSRTCRTDSPPPSAVCSRVCSC